MENKGRKEGRKEGHIIWMENKGRKEGTKDGTLVVRFGIYIMDGE
jgi:hypothetical protein